MDCHAITVLRTEAQFNQPVATRETEAASTQKRSQLTDMPIAAPFLHHVPNLRAFSVRTSIGNIAAIRRSGAGVPVLFIHNNSGSKEVFKFQLESALPGRHLLALDLPGHGESDRASLNQPSVYTLAGYARVVAEVIELLGFPQVVLCGWSLGGHVCMELMSQRPGLIKGAMITGAPPIALSLDGMQLGFRDTEEFRPLKLLMGKSEPLTREEAERFVKAAGVGLATQEECEYFILMAMRTDGNARERMIASMLDGSGGINERELVAQCPVPLMIVCGARDEGINTDYIKQLSYKALYQQQVHMIDDAGHGVFLEAPGAVDALLEQFLSDLL